MSMTDVQSDVTRAWHWEDPQRRVSSGNINSSDCPICWRSPPPNERSKRALRQAEEGEMNEYESVDEMRNQVLGECHD